MKMSGRKAHVSRNAGPSFRSGAGNEFGITGNPAVFWSKIRGFPAPSRGGCGVFAAGPGGITLVS